jgi:hypothetical protein
MTTLKEEAAPAGTTLEILAPYLPYGIEVETQRDGRGTLRWLSEDAAKVELSRFEPNPMRWRFLLEIKPVLRPFSHLATPLPDGTVPAVEVARLAVGLRLKSHRPEQWSWSSVQARFYKRHKTNQPYLSIFYPLSSGMMSPILEVTEDWVFTQSNDCGFDAAVLLDYLRSQHFAVGLEPHQFIAKAAAPIIVQEGSQEQKGGEPA